MGRARDEALMAEALRLAAQAGGTTYPNPAVGAVIVKGTRVVGRGYHRRWGTPHAEVLALNEAGKRARGTELFVTLEPCAHQGRTPPCTDAIIESGISRVCVATTDPSRSGCNSTHLHPPNSPVMSVGYSRPAPRRAWRTSRR